MTAEPRRGPGDGAPEPASQDAAPGGERRPVATPQTPPRGGPERGGPEQGGPEQGAPPQAQPLPRHKIRRTRISGLWVAIGFFAVVLLLLLIFILENNHSVDIAYFGFHGHLPLGVALLLAAVCGVLLVGLAGTARILQLRAAARRHRRADKNVTVPPRR